MGLMNLLQRGWNDVTHPFGIGSPQPAAAAPQQPIRTPAPMQQPRPIAATPAPGQMSMPKPIQQPQVHANVFERAFNQINPFDNGRTFKQLTPTNQGSVIHQATHNGATNVVGGIAKLPAQFAVDYSNAAGNLGRTAANHTAAWHPGGVGNNGTQIQRQTPMQQFGNLPGGRGLVKMSGATGKNIQLASDAAQIGLTAAAPAADSFVAKGLTRGISSLAPKVAPQIAAKVAPVVTGAAMGGPFNVISAVGNGQLNRHNFGQVYKQGTEFGAALPIAAEGLHVAAPIAGRAAVAGSRQIAKGVKAASENAMTTPAIRANLADQQALHDYSDYLSGAYKPSNSELNKLIANVRQVGQKHGIDLTNGTVASHIEGANSILDTLGKQRQAVTQGGYANVPFLEPGESNIDPLAQQYAAEHSSGDIIKNAAETMYQHDKGVRGGQLIDKTGPNDAYGSGVTRITEHTPFYSKYYAENGRAPSKAAYAAEAEAQLRAGGGSLIAPEEAQAYHLALQREASQPVHNPQTGQIQKPSAQLPKNALKGRNTAESPVMSMKQAMQAKRQQLEAQRASDVPAGPRPRGKAAVHAAQKARAADNAPEAPVAAPGKKLSRFSNVTVPNSDKVPENVRQLTQEQGVQYTPQATKAGQDAAQAFVKQSGSIAKATNKVLSNLHNTDAGKITRQDVFNAQAVADKLAKTGKPDDAMTSAEIYGTLSAHHTAAGQQIQAAAALAKQSPQGLHQMAIKAIKNGGKDGAVQKISGDLATKIANKVDEIAKAPEGSVARDDRVQELQKIVNQNVHHSNGSKLFTLWRTGLLTGPQTMTKVALSHALMAGAEKVKDVPAVAIDKGISGVSRLMGKGPMRSTALTLRGEGSGFKVGTQAAAKLMKTGLDTKGTGGFGDTLVGKLAHPEVDFGTSKLGKAANFYVQKTGGIHASIPKGFFTAAQSNDLFKQAIAEGKNMGLKGADLQKHVDNFVNGATDFHKAEAQLSAQRASFQQDTALGKVGHALQSVPGGKWMLPFAKIASTILNDAVDYSPAGALKAGWNAFKESKNAEGWTPTVQKHFVEELGRSITGTGAIMAGYQLYKHGVMTLGYPTSKPEQEIWKAQGKTPNSILIGGKWRDTASLGPFGTLLFMGGSVAQSGQHDAKGRSQVGAAATGAIQNITSQSYLSGLTSAANALSQPQQFAGSEAKQLAGSVVPIAVATAARATDNKQRNAPGVIQSVESKIPGARETLTPQQDMFGRQLNREGGVTTNLLDPSRPSGENAGAQVNELDRLVKTTGNSAVPMPVKTINGVDANGKKTATALTQAQQNAFNAAVGPKIKQAYSSIMSNPNYQQLTDANKVSALQSAKNDIETIQKAQTLKGINGNTVKLTAAQQAGQTPDYVQNKLNEQSGGTAGKAINSGLDQTSRAFLNEYNGMTAAQRTKTAYAQDNFDYKYALAQYNNNLLNGSLSKAGAITAKEALAKAEVGSNYSKDVRELYGLSKPEIQQFIQTDPNGAKYAQQLQSYDQALYNAGINKSRKFKNGFGSGGSGGGGSSSASLPTAINYKSASPKTNLGKFKVAGTKGVGSSKAKLVGYKTNMPTKAGASSKPGSARVAALPSKPKMPARVPLAKPATVFRPSAPKTKKFKGTIV